MESKRQQNPFRKENVECPSYFFTTQELYDSYLTDIPENRMKFSDAPEKMEDYKNIEQRPLVFDKYQLLLRTWLGYFSDLFIDYSTGTCNFRSEEFRNGMECVKQGAFFEDEVDVSSPDEALINRQCLSFFDCNQFSSGVSLIQISYMKFMLKDVGQDAVFFGCRDELQEGYVSHPTYCFAINQNSSRKQKAYQILKELLSESMQMKVKFMSCFGIPVSIRAQEKVLEQAEQGKLASPSGFHLLWRKSINSGLYWRIKRFAGCAMTNGWIVLDGSF